MSYQTVRTAIHTLILKHMVTDAATKDYVRMEMEETDTFHTDTFHEAADAQDDDIILEHLAAAYDEVRELVLNLFNNRWNFAPGYIKPHITIKEMDDVPDTDFRAAMLALTNPQG